jgi:hypothetical protein
MATTRHGYNYAMALAAAMHHRGLLLTPSLLLLLPCGCFNEVVIILQLEVRTWHEQKNE